MSDERTQQVTGTVPAAPEAVFALLSTPARHPGLDGAGMVRGVHSGPGTLSAVGEVFVMDMHQEGIGDYQMRNEVSVLDPGRRIGWAPSVHPHGALSHLIGDADPSGHTWVWELAADGAGGTTVTHTYDWSGVGDESALGLYPRVSTEQMAASVDRLAAALR